MTSASEEDETDRIVAAWQRERPDVDATPLQVLSRISRIARALDTARAFAFAAHRLEGWEFEVLAALRRAGTPFRLSPGQLAAQTLVTSGTMTNRIDRLERRGLVHRSPALQDRRGVVVELTQEGRTVVDAALGDVIEQERGILAALSDADQRTLASLLRRLQPPFH